MISVIKGGFGAKVRSWTRDCAGKRGRTAGKYVKCRQHTKNIFLIIFSVLFLWADRLRQMNTVKKKVNNHTL